MHFIFHRRLKVQVGEHRSGTKHVPFVKLLNHKKINVATSVDSRLIRKACLSKFRTKRRFLSRTDHRVVPFDFSALLENYDLFFVPYCLLVKTTPFLPLSLFSFSIAQHLPCARIAFDSNNEHKLKQGRKQYLFPGSYRAYAVSVIFASNSIAFPCPGKMDTRLEAVEQTRSGRSLRTVHSPDTSAYPVPQTRKPVKGYQENPL